LARFSEMLNIAVIAVIEAARFPNYLIQVAELISVLAEPGSRNHHGIKVVIGPRDWNRISKAHRGSRRVFLYERDVKTFNFCVGRRRGRSCGHGTRRQQRKVSLHLSYQCVWKISGNPDDDVWSAEI